MVIYFGTEVLLGKDCTRLLIAVYFAARLWVILAEMQTHVVLRLCPH